MHFTDILFLSFQSTQRPALTAGRVRSYGKSSAYIIHFIKTFERGIPPRSDNRLRAREISGVESDAKPATDLRFFWSRRRRCGYAVVLQPLAAIEAMRSGSKHG